MQRNGYFQLIKINEQTRLKVFAPIEGGTMFMLDELIHYLDMKKINSYNLVELNQYIKSNQFEEPFLISESGFVREHEEMNLVIAPKAEYVTARFYPPSTEGDRLSKEEILRSLNTRGIVYGIKEEVIDEFLKKPCYCTDYIIAVATMPVHGSDAKIEYHFDTNITARPKLNEDGSVDFHQLGNIKPVKKGEKLATLTPADYGKPGKSVLGNELPARKVKNLHLRYGRNIELSENRCEIFSQVAGHVTLVDDMVMVSDIYQVPQNVDASTGDIVYSGSVEIPGNVLTGFSVKADGDIIVNGVAEGARIEAEGNVVLKNGMQGMSRGEIIAKGNVIARFLENCNVTAGGDVLSDAMMHTNVSCRGKVEVTGRRGLITGGHIKTYGNIIVTNLGSNMGTDTKLEILSDTDLIKEVNELERRKQECEEEIKKIDKIFLVIADKLKRGEKLLPEQEKSVRLMMNSRPERLKEIEDIECVIFSRKEEIEAYKGVSICVNGNVYSGVKIVMKDIMKIMQENVSHCRFVLEGADIRITSI